MPCILFYILKIFEEYRFVKLDSFRLLERSGPSCGLETWLKMSTCVDYKLRNSPPSISFFNKKPLLVFDGYTST